MKSLMFMCLVCTVSVVTFAQEAGHKPKAQRSILAENRAQVAPADSDDVLQLQSDVDRLKVLLNQMRTNLAFVDTSQTPLKHQFELEADAWQVVVEQMDRRIQKIEKESRVGTDGSKPAIQTKVSPQR